MSISIPALPADLAPVLPLRVDVASGAMTETFACGTAAVITPVYTCKARTGNFEISSHPGVVSMRLREHLLAIQTGASADTHNLIHTIG